MILSETLQWGQAHLTDVSDNPTLDAQWLLSEVLDQSETSWLLTHGSDVLSAAQVHRYRGLVSERKTGKPLAYILGYWEFFGRRFTVTPAVLIPRPETEELVRQAVEVIKNLAQQKQRPLVVADLGTGSGCIAIILALEIPQCINRIYATDISLAALKIAQQNAEQYGVTDKMTFLEGNFLESIADKDIDIIVSNPPYIPSTELKARATTETRGLAFEPKPALDGGPDGQQYINQLKTTGIPTIVEVTGGLIQQFTL
jgi:release factor glutamine methyltransferase